jgi:mRNA-degrading endonuclease RelE of RelBE toxin-antitoxin system
LILYSDDAVADLADIRKRDGHEMMLMLFESCEQLDEPATRIMAQRLGGPDQLYRLRVSDYHITFQLRESGGANTVCIARVRRRTMHFRS